MPLFGRGSAPSRQTTVFFATDVHGSERTWRKFLNAATFYQADVLVMGGDVMGKLTIPIIREAGGTHRATIHGRVERMETAEDVAERVRRCLKHAPAERLSFAPDCGLSQTARWAARQKLANLVAGVKQVRRELGL